MTYRLMCSLCDMGHEASMLVMNKTGNDPRVHVIGHPLGRKIRFVAERAYIFTHNGLDRRGLFKVSVANTGYDVSRHTLVRDADAVILAWVNQGMMSLRGIRRLVATGKRVIWVMHDMWCMTGICHHALKCRGYQGECGNCPYIKHGTETSDLSRHVWQRKQAMYASCPTMSMVAVSSWLAGRAQQSSLLRDREITVIPNAFPDTEFYTTPRGLVELPSTIDTTRHLIVMGAARLDDPIKDFPMAIAALNHLYETRPDIAHNSQAVFYGNLRNPELLAGLRFPHTYLGSISNRQGLAELYAHAQVVLSTSLFETLPGTIIEGMAAGCTPVATGDGGQRDIIDHGQTGYITGHDAESIAQAIADALGMPCDRTRQHETIVNRFGSREIAKRYIRLIENGK